MFPVGIPRNPYIMISYSATCTSTCQTGQGKAHLESVLCLKSSLSADILLCTFEIDRGKVYHLI